MSFVAAALLFKCAPELFNSTCTERLEVFFFMCHIRFSVIMCINKNAVFQSWLSAAEGLKCLLCSTGKTDALALQLKAGYIKSPTARNLAKNTSVCQTNASQITANVALWESTIISGPAHLHLFKQALQLSVFQQIDKAWGT